MIVDFTDFLPEANIITLNGTNKEQVINELVDFASESNRLDKQKLHDAIWEREKQLSTALGHGLAVPHARLPEIEKPVIVLGICANEVADYHGIDKHAVLLIFLIITDKKNHQLYLDILKSISNKLFKDRKMIRDIVKNKDEHVKIKAMLTN